MTKGRWNYAVYTPEKVRKEMGSVLSNASTDSRWGGRPEEAKRTGREKGSSLDKGELGAQENKEVAQDHAGRRSDFWSPFQGVASEYQKGLGMCVVPCVQGCSPQHGVED